MASVPKCLSLTISTPVIRYLAERTNRALCTQSKVNIVFIVVNIVYIVGNLLQITQTV